MAVLERTEDDSMICYMSCVLRSRRSITAATRWGCTFWADVGSSSKSMYTRNGGFES